MNKTAIDTMQQAHSGILLNPDAIKPNRRPPRNSKRLMPAAEIARIKRKVTCGHCRGQDHYKTKCTKLHIDFPSRKKAKTRKVDGNVMNPTSSTKKV
jgi:hypothetical protein